MGGFTSRKSDRYAESRLTERFERPTIGSGTVAKNIDVVIVGAQFEKSVVWAIPPIQNLFH